MNFRSPSVWLVAAATGLGIIGVAAVIALALPGLFKLSFMVLGIIPILVTIVGLIDCLASGKPANITLLWIIIILLAPLLGPIIWFVWGKRNT